MSGVPRKKVERWSPVPVWGGGWLWPSFHWWRMEVNPRYGGRFTRHQRVTEHSNGNLHPKGLVTLEQQVGQLGGEGVVKVLSGLSGETHQEPVQLARGVDHQGVVEGVGQRHPPCTPSPISGLVYQAEKQDYC